MKILFFSTHDFEKNYLLKENKYGFDIDFISEPLNINTVSKAKKYEAICIFTCDDASKEVVDKIAAVKTGAQDKPLEPVVIESISIETVAA